MPQELHIGDGKYLTGILRIFADGGEQPKYHVMGGEKVQVTEGRRPAPQIVQTKDGFFYMDGQPALEPSHVQHLPVPFRAQALDWIKTKGATAKPLKAKVKPRARVGEDGRAPSPDARPERGESGAPLNRKHRAIDSEAALQRNGGVEVEDPEG